MNEAGSRPSTKSLHARHAALDSPAAQLELLSAVELDHGSTVEFERFASAVGWPSLSPAPLEVFQINLGKLCNMSCRHCHVDAGPDRTDAVMSRDTVDACLRALDTTPAHTVDLTGGAPELSPHFAYLVEEATARGKHVIDRCNLSVLLLPRFDGLIEWLGDRRVEIVASLPHYRKRNTDAQRGDGAFEKSIEALKLLNAAGYGSGDPARTLTLMSNPAGAFLAGNQRALEVEWKAGLEREHAVTFDRLLTLNNMPISRFLEWLADSDNLQPYMKRLVGAFNPETIAGLMCRNTISVSWDGRLFDCDFNQMLELGADAGSGRIETFDFESWQRRAIVTRRHCFGCTAGTGSGCGGATA